MSNDENPNFAGSNPAPRTIFFKEFDISPASCMALTQIFLKCKNH